jgi:hypothetical protein
MRDFNATDWHVATGTHSKRYPYWVTRTVDGHREYAPNGFDDVRKVHQ